jgi:hypothetical protein
MAGSTSLSAPSYSSGTSSSGGYDKSYDRKMLNSGYERVGSIARDGTLSRATGRGACSHHGGVAQWFYAPKKDYTSLTNGSLSSHNLSSSSSNFFGYSGKSKSSYYGS